MDPILERITNTLIDLRNYDRLIKHMKDKDVFLEYVRSDVLDQISDSPRVNHCGISPEGLGEVVSSIDEKMVDACKDALQHDVCIAGSLHSVVNMMLAICLASIIWDRLDAELTETDSIAKFVPNSERGEHFTIYGYG